MSEIFPYKKGSEWRRWDLHFHTPSSYDYKDGSTTNQDIIDGLLASEISVVAITDHHIIDTKRIKELQALAGDKITILPGIELRSELGGSESIHYIGIFPENSDIEDIWTKLQTKAGITKSDIITKGGDDKIYCDLKENCDSIHDLGGLVTVHAGGKSNSLESIKNNQEYKKTMKTDIAKNYIDIFELGQENDAEDYNTIVFPSIGFKKPMIICSDNHDIKNFKLKQNLWIKSDPNFNGLKQITYEPDERIRIQERSPNDHKTGRTIIDNILYKNSLGEEKIVYFNSDLNSIIGVRGSGKSTLLKNIAQKIDVKQYSEKDKKSPYPLNNFSVNWLDGQKDSGTKESPKSIFYIPQNYLSSLAYDDGDRTSDQRDEFLTTLLKKNSRFDNAIKSFEGFVSKNKIKIEELIEKLSTSCSSLKENEDLLKKQGSESEITEEIKNKNSEITKYKDTSSFIITDDEINNYSQSQKIINDNKKEVEILAQDREILSLLKENGANIFISDQQFNLLSSVRQDLLKTELNKKSKENLSILIIEEIEKIESRIKELDLITKEKEKIVESLDVKIKDNKALEDLTKELSTLQATQDKIKELSNNIAKSKEEISIAIDGLVDSYGDFERQQELIYKTIKFDDDFSFLKIEIITQYNVSQLKSFVERNINTRDTKSPLKNDPDIAVLTGNSPEKLSGPVVRKIIEGLISGQIVPKVEAVDKYNVISQLLRNRFEIDFLNSVKTGETCFRDMTGGQKAIALLELIFKFDDENYPILIDQPEDDLDVGGVATDLVNFIKSRKIDRQIIIVTHNASLVVCSDTENIIVSDIKRIGPSKYDFSYKTGSIENLEIRDEIIKVLEGGNDALRKRMLKLNIK